MLPVRRKRSNFLRHRGRSIFVNFNCTESEESILFLCRQQAGAQLLGFQQEVQEVEAVLYWGTAGSTELGLLSLQGTAGCQHQLRATDGKEQESSGPVALGDLWQRGKWELKRAETELKHLGHLRSSVSCCLCVPLLNIDAFENALYDG